MKQTIKLNSPILKKLPLIYIGVSLLGLFLKSWSELRTFTFDNQFSLLISTLLITMALIIFKPKKQFKYDNRLLSANFAFIFLTIFFSFNFYSLIFTTALSLSLGLTIIQIQLKNIIDASINNSYPYVLFLINCYYLYLSFSQGNVELFNTGLLSIAGAVQNLIRQMAPKLSTTLEKVVQNYSLIIFLIVVAASRLIS
jgi:hypothetical protein